MQTGMVDFKDGNYSIVFEKQAENKIVKTHVTFKNEWFFQVEPEEQEDIPKEAAFFVRGQTDEFPFKVETNLLTIPLHIPISDGRKMFFACMDFFIKRTHAPVHVGLKEHPGYPITTVSFDKWIINEVMIQNLISSIMEGIRTAEVTIEEKTRDEEKETDDLDDIDENNIIEYEEDEELLEIMKKPIDRSIKPLEGKGLYD